MYQEKLIQEVNTLVLTAAQVKDYENILALSSDFDGAKRDSVIERHVVDYSDGFQIDYKLCNGDSESGPFLDIVLFDEYGCQQGLCEPSWNVLGEFAILHDECVYTLKVEQE